MIPALKSEFCKLYTVRSTYIMTALAFILTGLGGFYLLGWRANRVDLLNTHLLATGITTMVSVVSVFVALIVALQVTHEYRYATINYAFTAINSRTKVFVSKLLVASVVGLLFTVVCGCLTVLATILGVHLHGLHLVPQVFDYRTLVWHDIFYGWGTGMAGFIIAMLIRNQIGTIVTLFIVPTTVESLLGLLLKQNVVYLPFSSLDTVIGQGQYPNAITPGHAAMVFCCYLIVGWTAAWILFATRDT